MAKTTENLKAASNGRDVRGKFARGNTIGPGRPRRETEREYLKAFSAAMTPAELAEITRSIAAKAKLGDVPAARLLYEYAIGRPAVRIEFDSDHEEYRVAGQSPAEGMAAMMQRIQEKVEAMRARESAVAAESKPQKRRKKR